MKDLNEIKGQLLELSEVVNNFKSEAVQLKIVEFILESEPEIESEAIGLNPKKKVARRKKAKKPTGKTAKKSIGQGAQAVLRRLIEEGFFGTSKSIGDIVQHCEHSMARKFKASDFSGKLARLVRDGTLVRNKNSDNKYEYTSK